MAERPAAARSRSVGRCDLLVEVAKSQLGPLWVATVPGAAGLEPRWVRCLALGTDVSPDHREALADMGRWSGGFEVQQAVSTLEVVGVGSDLCLVSAYVPGETLRSLLRLANFKRSPLPARIALRIILDLCEALLAAESRAGSAPGGPASVWGGLLPDSILVGVDGTTRVLELGVASLWRQRSSEAQHPEVTAYCAPEQLDRAIVDARADVFMLGILLWEMLSGGKRLFPGSSQRAVVERLRKHDGAAAGSGLPADSVDSATRALLSKLLMPDPESRFGGVWELKQELEAMGSALALPREVSNFVTSIAASALDSRERALGRTLGRAADRPVQPAAPEVVPAVDDEIEVEETGSVRAEDIMAALAVEDTEPESYDAPGLRPPVAALDVVDSTLITAPPSSGRRASPTAVVVPSIAAPDAEAFAPVPSVLQTLRGPGIPPPTFEFLRPIGLPRGAAATVAAPASPAEMAKTDAAEPRANAVEPAPSPRAASATTQGLQTASRGRSRLFDQRLPVVAALSGAAFVVVLGLVFALGGDKTDPSAERGPELMGARTSDSEQIRADVPGQAPGTDGPTAAAPRAAPAPASDEAAPARAEAAPAGAADATKSESATAGNDTRTESAIDPQAAQTEAEPAAAPASRVTPAPARVKRSSATVRTSAKKKKLRATRTYIPQGI